MQTGLSTEEAARSRIGLVTARYRELHGLIEATTGCGICLMAAVASLDPPREHLTIVVIGCFLAMPAIGYWLEQEYYPQRFGRVHSSDERNRKAWMIGSSRRECSSVSPT